LRARASSSIKASRMESELELQARACDAMGSPFVAEFLRAACDDYRGGSRVRDALDALAAHSRAGLRLSGAFHYLALAGEPMLRRHYPSVGGDGDARRAWHAASAILDRDPEPIERLLRENVQTNESLRSMPILGAFLYLAGTFELPFRIFEIGASAGLNSRFDRYHYVGDDWRWGNTNSPLVLRNRIVSGRPAHLDSTIQIAERRACDANPIDVADRRSVRRLESFVWPDQLDRLQRLRAALSIASDVDVEVLRENFTTWLPREVGPRNGSIAVVLQSVVEEHLAAAQRDELHSIVETIGTQATATAPFAYVRMELEPETYETSVQTWPERSTTMICRSDGHAQDIRWMQ
jgi:hypothetical protein